MPGDAGGGGALPPPAPRWVWRTSLTATQPYWEGWYRDLSEAFLKVGVCVRVCVLCVRARERERGGGREGDDVRWW